MSERDTEQTPMNHLSLVYMEASERSAAALQRAARRIRRNIRWQDEVLLLENACAIILPGTDLVGAEAVTRRIATLLADVEHEMRLVYGPTALLLLQRLQTRHPEAVKREMEHNEIPPAQEWQPGERDMAPYLAFLATYPSPRLLHLFPYELASRYRCVPVGVERSILTLATSQRLDYEIIAYLQTMTQRSIFQVRCEASMIADILRYWERVERLTSMQPGHSS